MSSKLSIIDLQDIWFTLYFKYYTIMDRFHTYEVLDHVEGGEHDPVGEPLGVIRMPLGLQGGDGAVSGIREPAEYKWVQGIIRIWIRFCCYPMQLARS